MANTTLNTNALNHPVRADEHVEIQKQEQEWFDLKPIEKKLCGYSLGLGIILLVIFILIFEVFR